MNAYVTNMLNPTAQGHMGPAFPQPQPSATSNRVPLFPQQPARYGSYATNNAMGQMYSNDVAAGPSRTQAPPPNSRFDHIPNHEAHGAYRGFVYDFCRFT